MHRATLDPTTPREETNMSMTRKHFKGIADILNAYTADKKPGTLHEHEKFDALVEDFAYFLQHTNPYFDRVRFFSAVTEYSKNWD